MPGAVIAIDQDRPSGTSAGSPGVARQDLWKDRTVRPRCATIGNSSFLWTLVDIPPGSSAAITPGTETQSACEFTPDTLDTVSLKLVTNGGGPGNVQILSCAVTRDQDGNILSNGWRVPALGEQAQQSNFGGQARGWDQAIRQIINDLRDGIIPSNGPPIGGGANIYPYLLQSGAVSTSIANPAAKLALGAVPFDPSVLSTTQVRFEAVLETSNAGRPAYIDLYDVVGGATIVSAELTTTAFAATYLSVDLPDLVSVSPLLLQARLWMDPQDPGDVVTCSYAALVLTTS